MPTGIFQWDPVDDSKAVAHPQDRGIHLAVGFLDKIEAGVWKAVFTLKAKSPYEQLGNELKVAGVTGGGITGLKTHLLLLCLHSPAQSQVLPLLSHRRRQSKIETHPSLLLKLDEFVKPVVRCFTAVSQAYCTEENHISWIILQLR